MPKRYHKKMRGGFWESWWNSTKKATSDAYNSVTGTKTSTSPSTITTTTPSTITTSPSTTTTPSTITTSSSTTTTPSTTPISSASASLESSSQETVGGRKRKTRCKRGGFNARTPTSGIAFHASPISDIKNAQPHNWLGGRTKRHRKHKHSKSCKHRKH